MDGSEGQLKSARRWVLVTLWGTLVLLGLGIRFAPRPAPPPRRATPVAEPASDSETRDDRAMHSAAPHVPATPAKRSSPAPWLFFVLPRT